MEVRLSSRKTNTSLFAMVCKLKIDFKYNDDCYTY